VEDLVAPIVAPRRHLGAHYFSVPPLARHVAITATLVLLALLYALFLGELSEVRNKDPYICVTSGAGPAADVSNLCHTWSWSTCRCVTFV
jgi:hypothetical protein